MHLMRKAQGAFCYDARFGSRQLRLIHNKTRRIDADSLQPDNGFVPASPITPPAVSFPLLYTTILRLSKTTPDYCRAEFAFWAVLC